jgi:hypothetical protein
MLLLCLNTFFLRCFLPTAADNLVPTLYSHDSVSTTKRRTLRSLFATPAKSSFFSRLSRLLAFFHLSFASADFLSQSTLLAVEWFSTNAYCRWHSSEHANTDLNFNRLLYRSTFFPQLQHDSSTFS